MLPVKLALSVALVCLAGTVAIGEERQGVPPDGDTAIACEATPKRLRLLPRGALGIAGVSIGKDTQKSVLQKLAGESSKKLAKDTSVCLRQPPDCVVFTFGPLGGLENLTAFALDERCASARGECRVIKQKRALSVGPLRLGASEADVARLLGSPTCTAGEVLAYRYAGTAKMTREESKRMKAPQDRQYWDVTAGIDVVLQRSRVTRIVVFGFETY